MEKIGEREAVVKSWIEVIEKMGEQRRQEDAAWRKANPPAKEIVVAVDDAGQVTIGFWKENGGVFFGQKYKNGYNPNSRIFLEKAVLEAAFSLIEGG